MAPVLPSNTILSTTTIHSRLTLKSPRLTVSAQQVGPFKPFGLGKPGLDEIPLAEESSNRLNGFSLDFGNMKSMIPVVSNPPTSLSFGNQNPGRRDSATVFVAGATGQAGIRITHTLLREGFKVRAGVPELGAAQDLARLAAEYKIISTEELNRFNAVESTFNDAELIAKAIGNASKVVVTIGPTENGPTAKVTTSDALQVIQAAQLAGVGHVAIIYDGTMTGALPYNNVLNGISTFFSNLFSRSQPMTVADFLQKVIETDVGYTFIRTSLTEDFSPESSYNVVVSAEGTVGANDYKVATSQIASLVADLLSNTEVAENKVVEVCTDPSAPSRPFDSLFSAIPVDGRRQAYAEALAKAKVEEEAMAATERAREAAEAAKKLEEEVKKLSEQEARAAYLAEEAREKAEAAGTSMESLMNQAKDISSGFSWETISSQIATAVPNSIEKPKVQIATVRGVAKARSLPYQKAIVKTSIPNVTGLKPIEQEGEKVEEEEEDEKPVGKRMEPEIEVRSVFGGLFKQEVIYIGDD